MEAESDQHQIKLPLKKSQIDVTKMQIVDFKWLLHCIFYWKKLKENQFAIRSVQEPQICYRTENQMPTGSQIDYGFDHPFDMSSN